ncbi:MAG: prepilin-type N-terminal cleavage/methylation domain-containing protein [Deltaproteobacteria bacterium]|nr:prepilin-type N-terminal cleavage/methylation domain-containing protein [Deltaproteobacteria bacterium]
MNCGRRTPASKPRGFTLIEVLVAIGIIALIALLIYSAFSGMSRSRTNMIAVTDRYQAGRAAMQRMAREFSSAYMSGHKNFFRLQNQPQTGLIGKQGKPDRVDFTSFSHLRLQENRHESDQTEIAYYCARRRDTGTLDLVRRATRLVDSDMTKGGVVEIMAEDVVDLELRYLDPVTNEWQTGWDSTQAAAQFGRLPAQIWITLSLANGPGGQAIRFEEKVNVRMMLPLTFATD